MMNGSRSLYFSLVVSCLIAGTCGNAPAQIATNARIVRILPDAHWKLSVDGQSPKSALSFESLSNLISNLSLSHGDVILFGRLPTSLPKYQTAWLGREFKKTKVSVFVYRADLRSKVDIFSIPVFHWTAPYENVRSLAESAFFYEGHLLGVGDDGYDKMLKEIRKKAPERLFILGSLIDPDRGFGPFEAPYENRKRLLDDLLTELGIKIVYPSELIGL